MTEGVTDAGWAVEPGDAASRVLLHVPHGSAHVPAEVRAGLLLDDAGLADELAAMTDSGTTELAAAATDGAARRPWRFVNLLSRLVVDPERFPDAREEMRAVGMGAVYTRTSRGAPLRDAEDPHLLATRYRPYADALAALVAARLDAVGAVVLLDVHSYPAQALPYELHGDDRRPQVCLGTDAGHTPQWLLDAAQAAFAGLEVALDQPFRGTYVPLDRYGTDRRVSSLMVEVRRDVPPDGDAVVAALTRLVDAVG